MTIDAELQSLRQRNAELERRLTEVEHARGLLEKLFDSTRAIAYVLDAKGRFLRWSPYFYEKILGWLPEDLARITVLETLAPEDRVRISLLMQSTAQPRQLTLECRALAKDGRRIAIVIYSTRLLHDDQVVFAGQAFPIEDRIRAETQFKESEKRFEAAFRASPAIMAISELETGRFIEVNQKATETLGYTRDEMVGHTSLELGIWLYPEQRHRVVEALKRRERQERLIVNFVGKDKRVHDLEWFAEIISIGGKAAMLTLLNDITERLAAEKALAARDEHFHRLLNDSRDVIAVLDPAGKTLTVLGACQQVFGFTPQSLLGRALADDIFPEDRSRFLQFFGELTQTQGTPRTLEVRLRHADGHFVPVELIATNLLSDPIIAGTVWNVRDISSRVAADAEHRKLESRLQQAAKMEAIGRLAGGVAHDFNNLLTVISGNVEISRVDSADSAALHEHLNEIERAAHSAATLTRQLLTFSRQQPHALKTVEFDSLFRDFERMLRRVIGEDIQLAVTLNDSGSLVRIDPGHFEQIVLNLAINARDAMPTGGTLAIEATVIELDAPFCRTHQAAQPGHYVLMSVTDSGQGIPMDVQPHIFEPFFTTKDIGHGTGLGLATVHGIVEQAGGGIDVYSELGIGTTFKVYLPRVEDQAVRLPSLEQSRKIEAQGETVLVVEDDAAVRAVVIAFLEQLGYRVYAYASGPAALRFVTQGAPELDLLLTDVIMPEMNGRELVEAVTRLRPSIAVLYASGYAEAVIKQRQVLAGGVHFISKPYSMRALGLKLREVLEKT